MHPIELPKCKCGATCSLYFQYGRHWCPRCLCGEIERLRKLASDALGGPVSEFDLLYASERQARSRIRELEEQAQASKETQCP